MAKIKKEREKTSVKIQKMKKVRKCKSYKHCSPNQRNQPALDQLEVFMGGIVVCVNLIKGHVSEKAIKT